MAHIEADARTYISVIEEQIRKKVEPIFRKHVLMGALKKRGRISYNHSSHTMIWRPRVKRRSITPGVGNVPEAQFPRTVTKIKCELPWRSYWMGESTTKFEELASQNRETAMFRIVDDAVSEMSDDFAENFNDELFIDGNLAGNTERIHGLESLYSVNGLVNHGSSGNGVVGLCNDTYAGHATAYGDLGGDWTPDTDKEYPTGSGDHHWHAWSPLVVDYNNTNLGGSTANWPNQWQRAIRFATSYGQTLQRAKYDVLLLETELLRTAKDSLENTQRSLITSTAGTELNQIGFQTLEFEGLEMTDSYGVPDAVGYFINFDKLELRSMQKQLVMPEKDWDITTSQKLFKLDAYLNMVMWAPSFFAKLQGISTAGT